MYYLTGISVSCGKETQINTFVCFLNSSLGRTASTWTALYTCNIIREWPSLGRLHSGSAATLWFPVPLLSDYRDRADLNTEYSAPGLQGMEKYETSMCLFPRKHLIMANERFFSLSLNEIIINNNKKKSFLKKLSQSGWRPLILRSIWPPVSSCLISSKVLKPDIKSRPSTGQ